MRPGFHEDFSRRELPQGASDRSFGVVFAMFFAVVSLWPVRHGNPLRGWALALSGAFLGVALAFPRLLHPLNWLWTRFGLLLSRVTNPILTGLMFYLLFTPMALVLRALGKDLLRLKFDPMSESYWIPRNPPGPPPETMRRQF
jgi:hypothetical protein